MLRLRNEYMEKKLSLLVKQCKSDLKKIGIEIGDDIKYEIDSRSKTRLGVFFRKERIIKISEFMFYFSDQDIRDTIVHEMIHSLPYQKGHDVLFRSIANKVNKSYSRYNISVSANMETLCKKNYISEKDYIEMMGYKYKVECMECHNYWYQHRISKWASSLYRDSKYMCSKCHSSNFKVEKLQKTN